MAKMIGIAELQRRASQVVNEVRSGRAEYEVTSHGGPVGVALVRLPDVDPTGITPEDLMLTPYFTAPAPSVAVRQAQLDAVEAARDAAGQVGA
ncbi:MAG: type II toxin-antitoxin system Phd/YefM family antitoxin [Bifidobacteriaceae bacterium]|jgi:prevent-host-death family protein|nr:type II toxin-antitoxin system Phd/YefM family antitoxin [Bifidobacteriaceae bacterium]